jgi:hypothetical protein
MRSHWLITMMTLHVPVVSSPNGKMRATSKVTAEMSELDLWFEVNHSEILPTQTMDAYLVACLLPAMISGQDIYVKGNLSSKLFYNVTHYLVPILTKFLPSAKIITIRPASLSAPPVAKARGVLAGFSGGVDSFCNYYDHSGNRAPVEFLITHFLFSNVGSHGQRKPDFDREVFSRRAARLENFAKEEGKVFITVDSNIDEIIGMDFQLTHTIRNASVALLTQNIVSKFYYASTYAFADTEVKPSYDMAHLDPVILPLLGTEKLDCIASGGQYSRVNKTRLVAEMESSTRYLDVCVEPSHARGRINCSICWKCLRTELTLSAFGQLDRYNEVFDVNTYRQIENLYLLEVLRSSNTLLQELETLIGSTDLKNPRLVRLLAAIIPENQRRRLSHKLIGTLMRRPRASRLINACLRA